MTVLVAGLGNIFSSDDGFGEPGDDVPMDAHDLGPDAVLSLVPRLGGTVGPVVVVGCEPAGIDAGIGLSPAVQDAVGTAVQLVIDVITGQVAGRPVGATEGES
jgi:hydrogenase maturation protease